MSVQWVSEWDGGNSDALMTWENREHVLHDGVSIEALRGERLNEDRDCYA